MESEKLQLPGYEILEKAGVGGMATVWTARQTSLDRIVAIKALAPELTKDPEAVKRFHAEAKSAAKLRHPGIVQVYDAGEHEDIVYITMEYVPGITVAELLERRKRIPEKTALSIAEAVALALEYAADHANIIHCDIKPDNVLIERDGTIKVADLGLAQVVGALAYDTGKRDMMGTPNYTSPEQARGFNDLDCRTDIYSLGAMLYHMVTGILPFGDSPPDQILEKQLYGFLPDPKEENPEISSALAWLIEKMMIKDRTLRSKDWADVVTDLQELKHGGVPAGKMPSAGHSTVLRSELRSKEPSATQSIKVSEIAKREAQDAAQKKPKQKIILPKEVQKQIKTRPRKKKSEAGPVLVRLLGLLIFVVGGYSFVMYLMKMPQKSIDDVWTTEKERAQAKTAAGRTPAAKPAGAKESFKPAFRTTDGMRTGGESPTVRWKNSDFRRGAEAFNRALKTFNTYQEQRGDPGILQSVEKECRTAIAAFEKCKDLAPPDIDIAQYINQCYHLISDTRQSMLLVPSVTSGKSRGSAVQERPGPRQPVLPAPTSSTGIQEEDVTLSLAPTWKMGGLKPGNEVDDLYALLKNQGRPEVDLTPDPSIRILDRIYYLMPLQDACSALNIRVSARRSLSSGAFPRNSFYYYSANGDFGGGFSKLLLITDTKDQVVGAELVNETPDSRLWFEPHNYSPEWHVYDIINGKTKGNAKWRVAHMVEREKDLVLINSELVTYDKDGYFELGQTKARVSLMLPQPIVNLVLYMVENQPGGPAK